MGGRDSPGGNSVDSSSMICVNTADFVSAREEPVKRGPTHITCFSFLYTYIGVKDKARTKRERRDNVPLDPSKGFRLACLGRYASPGGLGFSWLWRRAVRRCSVVDV
jgi:hypothetical protein